MGDIRFGICIRLEIDNLVEGLAMTKCNNCGLELPDEAMFCLKCGTKLEKKLFCSNCNKELPKDAIFCMYCGKEVLAQEKSGMQFVKEDNKECFSETEADSYGNDKAYEKASAIALMKSLMMKYYDIKRVSSDGSCWIVEGKEGAIFCGGGLKVVDEPKLLEKYENTISKASIDEKGEYYSKKQSRLNCLLVRLGLMLSNETNNSLWLFLLN